MLASFCSTMSQSYSYFGIKCRDREPVSVP